MVRNPPADPKAIPHLPGHYFGVLAELVRPPEDLDLVQAYIDMLERHALQPDQPFPLWSRLRGRRHTQAYTRLDARVGASARTVWQRGQGDLVLKLDANLQAMSGNQKEIINNDRYMQRTRNTYVHYPVHGHSASGKYLIMSQAAEILSMSNLTEKEKDAVASAAYDYVPDPGTSNLGAVRDASGATYWATVDYDFGLTFTSRDETGEH